MYSKKHRSVAQKFITSGSKFKKKSINGGFFLPFGFFIQNMWILNLENQKKKLNLFHKTFTRKAKKKNENGN